MEQMKIVVEAEGENLGRVEVIGGYCEVLCGLCVVIRALSKATGNTPKSILKEMKEAIKNSENEEENT